MKPRYYLKIPFAMRSWYPGVIPADWREAIWRDVTEDGSALVFERLPPNDLGDRLALHGEHFCVQVGRDKDRYDVLYAIRIEPAEKSLPRSNPVRVACDVELWPGGNPVFRDAAGALLRVDGQPDKAALTPEVDEEEDAVTQAQPSPLLLTILAQAPAGTRSRFRPGESTSEPADARAFIEMLSTVWHRRRLHQLVSPTSRQETLLKRLVKPPVLGRKERDGLLALFGFAVLNRAALQHRDDAGRFFLLVDDLSSISLPAPVRAVIWTSALAGLQPTEFRQELHASSSGLKRLANEGIPAEKAWEDGLLKGIREVAGKHDDQSLRSLAETAEAAEDPVGHIALWASELAFQNPTGPDPRSDHSPASSPNLPVALVYPASVRPPAEPSHPADVWALRCAGVDLASVHNIQRSLASVFSPAAPFNHQVAHMSGLLSLTELVGQLKAETAGWATQLPDIDTAASELASALRTHERLTQVVPEAVSVLLESATPLDGSEICDLLEREEVLRASPAWLWTDNGPDEKFDPLSATLSAFALRFADPGRRRRLTTLVSLVDQLGEPASLRWLDPPRAMEEIDQHIQVWFDRSRELLNTASAEFMAWLRDGTASLADLALLDRARQELEDLKAALSADTARAVQEHVEAVGSPHWLAEAVAGHHAGRTCSRTTVRMATDGR